MDPCVSPRSRGNQARYLLEIVDSGEKKLQERHEKTEESERKHAANDEKRYPRYLSSEVLNVPCPIDQGEKAD